MKKGIIAFLLACVALLLGGCWDKLELEEQAFVVVLGLDKAPDGLVSVTFQVANPQVGSSDKGAAQNEPPSDIVTFAAPDILSAKEIANSVITRKISFAHLRTIIISQAFAGSELFNHVIGSSIRDPEMRRETNLIISRERAADFIARNNPRLETRPHKYYAFMQERWRDTGYVPSSTLNRYFQRLSRDTLFLAIYGTTKRTKTKYAREEDQYRAGEIPQRNGDPVQIMGSAVFKSGRMVGTITGEETRMALFLRRKSMAHSYISSYPDPIRPGYQVTARLIKDGDTRVKMDLSRERPDIHVTLPLRAQILSIPSFTDYAENPGKQEKLRKSIEDSLKEKMDAFIAKTQQTYECEPFLWHLVARKHFWTLQAYQKYDWGAHFSKAKVQVTIRMRIESFGKQIGPPLPLEIEEEQTG